MNVSLRSDEVAFETKDSCTNYKTNVTACFFSASGHSQREPICSFFEGLIFFCLAVIGSPFVLGTSGL